MATATERVFAIPELLEQILLEDAITQRDLFVLQRVSRQFNTIVDGTKVQKRMYLCHGNTSGSINPLLGDLACQGFTGPDNLGCARLYIVPRITDSWEHNSTSGVMNVEVGFVRWTPRTSIIGLQGRKIFHPFAAGGSWTKTRISSLDVEMKVEIRQMVYPYGWPDPWSTNGKSVVLGSQNATLASLINVVEESEVKHVTWKVENAREKNTEVVNHAKKAATGRLAVLGSCMGVYFVRDSSKVS